MSWPSGLRAGSRKQSLHEYYERLLAALGSQDWWPARTRWEVILGVILTQNTSWRNAAQALAALRAAEALPLGALRELPLARLEQLIRPSGYYRQKAGNIRAFVEFLHKKHNGSLDRLFRLETADLREELLGVKGLGPESVDSILLYAGRRASFVVDGYTRRILWRHGWMEARADYPTVQELFHRQLPAEAQLFNEYHALLVEVGKRFCKRTRAHCEDCPLNGFLPVGEKPVPMFPAELQWQRPSL